MTSVGPWLLEDVRTLDGAAAGFAGAGWRGADASDAFDAAGAPVLAVSLDRMVIHDNRKWFGEADIRLDALVVHGHSADHGPEGFYSPGTFRFARVADHDALPIGDSGLLLFYGTPVCFLDLFLTVSRDRKDTDDLAVLLSDRLQDDEVEHAIGTFVGLIAAPEVAAVTAAVAAAARLGDFAYRILRQITGSTVGLFHTSWLQHRDGFGIGQHPPSGDYRVKDLSFAYRIAEDVDPHG